MKLFGEPRLDRSTGTELVLRVMDEQMKVHEFKAPIRRSGPHLELEDVRNAFIAMVGELG